MGAHPSTTIVVRTEDDLVDAVRDQVRELTAHADTPTLEDVVFAALTYTLERSLAKTYTRLIGDVYLLTGAVLPCCAGCDDELLDQWLSEVRSVVGAGPSSG